MKKVLRAPNGFNPLERYLPFVLGTGALAFGLLTIGMLKSHPPAPRSVRAPAKPPATPLASNPYGALVVDFGFRPRNQTASLAQTASEAKLESDPPAREIPQTESVAEEAAPLPPRRPAELRAWASHEPPAARNSTPPSRTAALPAAPSDNRSFFEKLFGSSESSAPQAARPQSSGPVLAYAATPDIGLFGGLRSAAPSPSLHYDRWTAVYDISAHTVYMPDGTKLEAHSGLRERLDDPRYVHERMRGPTPPHLYELSPREQLFHGVEALRLTPTGGGNIFGRAGLLAHTYMLGPNGDSNGCVSFRNYGAFLQAYKKGEVRRLAVVARLDR